MKPNNDAPVRIKHLQTENDALRKRVEELEESNAELRSKLEEAEYWHPRHKGKVPINVNKERNRDSKKS